MKKVRVKVKAQVQVNAQKLREVLDRCIRHTRVLVNLWKDFWI